MSLRRARRVMVLVVTTPEEESQSGDVLHLEESGESQQQHSSSSCVTHGHFSTFNSSKDSRLVKGGSKGGFARRVARLAPISSGASNCHNRVL